MKRFLHPPVRSPFRWAAALTLLVTAGTHIPLIPEHLEEAPYVGALFIALSLVSSILAVAVVVRDVPAVWAISGTVTLLALVAFLVSRTVGLPQIGDDIGNWTEPLGYPALAAELATVVLAGLVIGRGPTGAAGTTRSRLPLPGAGR
ncbi:MAG TPA: hypothetical protein VI452_02520 [Marmoricola sp.]|jgi:hypothetical protein